jgi:hypothetical protein
MVSAKVCLVKISVGRQTLRMVRFTSYNSRSTAFVNSRMQ